MKLQILGCRGIPARHGGFETFTEHFAVYLRQKGWQVTVYCQEEGSGGIYEDDWRGIHRVHIPVAISGAKGTVVFDLKSTVHAVKRKIPVLTLGYNTAIFCTLYRVMGVKNIINMDGIEWQRGKWGFLERSWLFLNEKFGAWLGDNIVADHPEIKNRLACFTRVEKITVIPYGADIIGVADPQKLLFFGLEKYAYALIVARPEQENSILEIVRAYSLEKRGKPLVVLGEYTPENTKYHKKVLEAAGDEIRFVGAIYDQAVVQALRFFARFYIHGYTVGGTNPSLVEALGAGSPVLAHDNIFNRWVAGDGAGYFSTEEECAEQIGLLLQDDDCIASMRRHSFEQIKKKFTWDTVHRAYEQLILDTVN